MFDALNILFKELNLSPINERTDEIPEVSVQLDYLQTLRNILNNDN